MPVSPVNTPTLFKEAYGSSNKYRGALTRLLYKKEVEV
jgi:hypothetical protein